GGAGGGGAGGIGGAGGGGAGGASGGGGAGGSGGGAGSGGAGGGTIAEYTNPIAAQIAGGGVVENCPDPAIVRGQTPGHEKWYLYCTSDPLNKDDKGDDGTYNERLIPTLESEDLVTWAYVGNALTEPPAWAAPGAELWAPDVQFFNGQYYLYYVVTDTAAGGSAIGVATSESPTGPWAHAPAPVVEPHPAPCCAGSRRWVYDPSVVAEEGGQRYIYYGSYFGGISVRRLSADGLSSDPLSQAEVTIANRYEAAYVVRRGPYYYLFASAANCCNGPLSGYSVFVGRSASPLGPFVDREGVSLLASSVGGTPVLAQGGNRWVGTGHNAVFTDFAGQDWAVYHAVDLSSPYLEDAPGDALTLKRQPLLDPIDWVDGWPAVRGGQGASDGPMPAPAARPGDADHYEGAAAANDEPGPALAEYSDELDGEGLDPKWSWVRPPADGAYALGGGALRVNAQFADLFEDSNSAPVLLENAPAQDYLVEAKVTLDVPGEGCCFNFTQAGLIVYKDDDNFIKLVSFSNWDTRQIEFAKEVGPAAPGFPRYGGAVVGAHARTLWLRLVKRGGGAGERYTAYTSRDGVAWVRGSTWTHELGAGARIGLVSMGAPSANSPFPAFFDYVRVYGLQN
ncbi:MAG TPA: family 43 glycosylhydrolase, partial [Polyangiaceae bacterium]|nr:family 43 glycosylhydrolase [Polyangiaceae bacterium]